MPKFDNRPKDKKREKEKRRFWIIANCFIIPIGIYLGGVLGQLFYGYGKLDISTGTSKEQFMFSFSGILSFYKEHFLAAFCGLVIALIGLNLFAYYIKLSAKRDGTDDESRNFSYSDKDTYGTSRWMNDEEKKRVLNSYNSIEETDELIMGRDTKTGQVLTMPNDSKLNKHKTIIGGSGSGKTAAVVRNDIFQNVRRGVSMVLTDPSGELFESMGPYLRKRGYNVKVFNLVNIAHSDSWNCLEEIGGDDINAQIFADVIIKNTDGDKNGDFWSKCAMNLLKALCLYVERNPAIPTNIGEVYKLLTNRTSVELDQLFDALPMNEETQAAKMAYNVYKNASDNVKGGVLIDLGSRLQVFQGALIRKITSYSEINLTELGNRKSAYFVITSDQHSAFDFLAVLFYSMLFIKLVDFAQKNGGKLPVPVNFLLDEFPNIGAIPDFEKKISTVRKYQIDITVIIQNIAQIQNRYPKGLWEEIIGNCDVTVFLGCTDMTTAKYISENTGVATVVVDSQNHSKNMTSMLRSLDYKESSGLGKRAIMNADEIKQMRPDEAILFIHGEKPLKVKKIYYWEHPEYEKLTKESIGEYMPEWKKNESLDSFAAKKEEEKIGTS